MKRWSMIGMGMIAWAWASSSFAAVQMLECAGCTAQQEEAKIKSGSRNGWFFTYNIPSQRLRKFLTYLEYDDSATHASPVTKAARSSSSAKNWGGVVLDISPATAAEIAAIGPGTHAAGWHRVVEEYPVDQSVRTIFNSLVDTESQYPGVNFRANRARIPIENLGLTVGPIAPRFFDPREIAWNQQNGGEFNDFIDRVTDTFESQVEANRVSPVVGKLINDIRGQAKSVSVGIGPEGVTAGLEIERMSEPVQIKVCDSKENCVYLTLSKNGTYVQVTYEKTVDSKNITLPVWSNNVNMRWPSGGGQNATEYSNWLRNRGYGNTEIIGGSSGCAGYVLACTGITDTTLLACKLFCQ